MAQTVIGIFDDASEAQTAMQELMEAGFSRNNLDLSTTDNSTATGSSYTNPADMDDDNDRKKDKGGISGFFASLFGDDDDDRDRYTTVGERHSILTVHAQSEDEAERAADILDEAGAIDVDERAQHYQAGTYAANPVSGEGYATGSGITTGVSADPLAPAYGATTGITTDTTDYSNRDVSDRNSSINEDGGSEWNSSAGTHQQDMGQQMGDRGNRNRSRIFDRSLDETNRLRDNRSWNNNESMKRPDADTDVDRMANVGTTTNTGYNRTVDPESDVTNR